MADERTGSPYRDDEAQDILYRRTSRLARWAPFITGGGAILLVAALVLGVLRFPWDTQTNWIVFLLVMAGFAAVLTPELARRRMRKDPSLLDPGNDLRRADRVSTVGLTTVIVLAFLIFVAPIVLLGLWVLLLVTGVVNWPFG